MASNLADLLRLVLVTDDDVLAGRDLVALCLAAEQGGVTAVQLRLKRAPPREQVTLARALRDRLSVPLLVNDRADVALAAGAAGVHLGADDVPVSLVRRIAPPGFIIGASVGDDNEARAAAAADYWGVGPWRATTTKPDAGASLGAPGFGRIVQLAGARPCIAIGGVRPSDVGDVRRAGGAGVAVVSGILAAADVAAAARRYASAAGFARSRGDARRRSE